LAKLILVGLAASEPGAAPVPDSGTVVVLEPFLDPAPLPLALTEVIEIPPITAPIDCGAKVTLQLTLCPAGSVSGRVIPLNPKPLPVSVICEMVRLLPPGLVRVITWGWLLLPTITGPKLMLEGLTPSCGVVDVIAVPNKGRTAV
jgi:hypothetical protein